MTWQNMNGTGRCVNTTRSLTPARCERARRNMTLPPITIEWIMQRVIVDDAGCWLWQRKINKKGYGQATRGSLNGKPVSKRAHRLTYEMAKGEIPATLVIDHLCRVRHCVNPDHLEAVTPKENTRRGNSPSVVVWRTDTCTRGHKLSENLYVKPDGALSCRICARIRGRENDARRRKQDL